MLISSAVSPQETLMLYPLKIDGKYGYINIHGELVIKPEFDKAENFSDGLALVIKEGRSVFINVKGEIIISGYAGRDMQSFSEGLAAIRINNKWGFIDTTGKFVIDPRFQYADTFSEGVARARETRDDDYIYITKNGQNAFPGKTFRTAQKKSGGYMVVGQQIYPDSFEPGEYEGETVTIPGIRRGVIDANGDIVIPIENEVMGIAVSDGIIHLARGFVNMRNEVIIQTRFRQYGRFYKGIVPVSSDGKKYGIVDKKGK
jgi:hypothetical protein